MTHQCLGCKLLLPLEQFYASRAGKNGLSSRCRSCTKISNAKKYQKNKESILRQQQEYRQLNAAQIRARTNPLIAQWKKNNPAMVAAQAHRRRMRLAGVEGENYTAQQWRDLCEQYAHICLSCQIKGIALTVDHVIPLSKGGMNPIDNIQPLCQSCNSTKGTKTIDYRPQFTSNAEESK